jgi:hypothetical protein
MVGVGPGIARPDDDVIRDRAVAEKNFVGFVHDHSGQAGVAGEGAIVAEP